MQKRVLMMLALAAAPAIAAVPDPAAPRIPDPPKPHVEFRPSHLQINGYVSFDEQGNPQNAQYSCSLSVLVITPKDLRPTGSKNLRVTRIVTDTGSEVPPQATREGTFVRSGGFSNGRMSVQIPLPPPPPGARAFAEISGTMTLQCAVGPLRRAGLPPLKEIAGKRVKFDGLAPEVWVVVHRGGQGSPFRIEMSSSTRGLLANTYINTNGVETRAESNGSSSDGSTVSLYYRNNIADDTRITLEFHSRLDNIEIPFKLRDVTLPQPPPAKGGEITVKAEPVIPGAPAAANAANPKPAPNPGDLRPVFE